MALPARIRKVEPLARAIWAAPFSRLIKRGANVFQGGP